MDISREARASTVLVAVQGEVELATSLRLHRALSEALAEKPERLVVDLSGVSFLDASGLGVLLRHTRRARRAGTELIVVKAPTQVHRVFEITGVDELLTIVDDAPE